MYIHVIQTLVVASWLHLHPVTEKEEKPSSETWTQTYEERRQENEERRLENYGRR